MVFCIKPWTEIHLYNTGVVGSCCREPINAHFLGSTKHKTPESIWYGEKARKLRQLVIEGRKETAGCSQCVDLSLGLTRSFPHSSKQFSLDLQKEIDSSESGFPLRVYFQTSYKCNMSCSHCSQTHLRLKSPEVLKPFPIRVFQKAYDSFFPNAKEFLFVGGEVSISDNFYRMLQIMNPEDNPDCLLGVVTNGTLIKRMIPPLAKFSKVLLHISVDAATEGVYEKIRRGKWKQLLSNVRSFFEYGKKHGLDWTVTFNFLIMKSNIHELDEMVKFAVNEGADMSFGMIYGTEFQTENVFVYKELLENIEWKTTLSKALTTIKTLPETEWTERSILTLEGVERYLETEPDCPLNTPLYKVKRIWLEKVCQQNHCSYHEDYNLRKALKLLRKGEVKHTLKRAYEKVLG